MVRACMLLSAALGGVLDGLLTIIIEFSINRTLAYIPSEENTCTDGAHG